MRGAARLVAVVAVLAAAVPARATNGMRMIGFGPVQGSMGGVGVGATLDASSVASNPAGLTELGGRLDVGATWFKPTVDYQATEAQMPPGFTGAVVAQPGQVIDSRRGGSLIPAVGAAFPVGDSLALGIGLFGVAGMGVNYPSNLYGGPTYTSYMQARLTPGLGWKINDAWSVGVTFNAMLAQMKWDVAAGFGQQPHDTASSYGYGATFGVKFRPVKSVALGLAYETKSIFQEFKFDVPAHGGVNPATFAPVPFPGGTDRLQFDQPSVTTLGAAWSPIEALLLAADLEWIRWSQTNGKNQPTFNNDTMATGAMPWNMNWEDQMVLKVGAQFQAPRGVKVRVGYNYGKMPLDPDRAFENIAFPAVAEHHFTAGLGWDVGAWGVNVGGTYAPRATLKGSNGAYPAMGGQAIASYETRMSQYAVDLGVSYRF